ncbi:hypothetical protein NECAME_03972 [Necator americanus]|uniref:Uncharacterized protein n=1 Tax=Necator americanus TaxID=51031 RepID=W2SYM2_NECAM|nr:hypothetical protein NECAME_03972 [Necator americanus]ETN74658.1 hypothetical protein NECAME_03972 [Necator americanus]
MRALTLLQENPIVLRQRERTLAERNLDTPVANLEFLRAVKSWSTGPLLMPRTTWQPDIPTRNRVKKLNGADEKNRYIFSCTNNSCNFHIRMNIAIPPTDRENVSRNFLFYQLMDHSETSLEETVFSTEETVSSKEENQNQEVADDDCEDGDEAVLDETGQKMV